jgi:hypothetical protein
VPAESQNRKTNPFFPGGIEPNSEPPVSERSRKRKKYSLSLAEFCAEAGVQFTSQILLPNEPAFVASLKTAGNKLERPSRVWPLFGESRFRDRACTHLRRLKVNDPPTVPYVRDEIAALFAAGDEQTDWQGHVDEENAHRLCMFVLFLRTIAVELLLERVTIERVSVLLWHASGKALGALGSGPSKRSSMPT